MSLVCPNCNATIQYHLVNGTPTTPETGDMAVCFSCGERMVFGRDGQSVGLTEEMIREMPLDWQAGLQRQWDLWSEKYSIRGS